MKSHAELITDLASDQQAVTRRAKYTREKLSKREAMLSQLDVKFQLLAEKVRCDGNPQKLLHAKLEELESAKRDLQSKECALKERSHDNSSLEVDLVVVQDVIG